MSLLPGIELTRTWMLQTSKLPKLLIL